MLSQSPKRKPGPKPTGKGTLVGVRLQPSELAKIDRMRAETGETRPEVIRRIIEQADA